MHLHNTCIVVFLVFVECWNPFNVCSIAVQNIVYYVNFLAGGKHFMSSMVIGIVRSSKTSKVLEFNQFYQVVSEIQANANSYRRQSSL